MTAKKEILFDGYFYDVTNFIDKHPGGAVIRYYTEKGEDSTHAIQQFHLRSKERVKMMMSGFKKRPASDDEIGLDTAVLQKNRALTEDFTKLYLELESEGCFKPSYMHVFMRILELLVFHAIGAYLFFNPNGVIQLLGFIFIVLGKIRTIFVVHEFGHNSSSGSAKVDRFLLAVVVGFFLGLSGSRWTRQHNRHHAMAQRFNHDVDLETMPILAYNIKIVEKYKDKNGFMIHYQTYLFVVDTLLVLLIWMFYQHPKFALKQRNFLEITALLGNCVLYYHLGFWVWLLSTWIIVFYMFFTFSLNHTFLPVATEPTHWVEYALHHTANVAHGAWYDWWTGYLNYQIEHHLFPTMPNFRLPLIKDRVRALAKKHNIQYHHHLYSEAVRKTIKNLNSVAAEAKHL